MTGKKIIIKGEEIQAPKHRMTPADYGFYGRPVTKVIQPARGKGHEYNRAQQKRKNKKEEIER